MDENKYSKAMPAVEISPVNVKPPAPPELLCHPVPCWMPGQRDCPHRGRAGDPAAGQREEKPPAPTDPKQRRLRG